MGSTVQRTFSMKRSQIAAFVKDPKTIRDIEALEKMLAEDVPNLLGGKVDESRQILTDGTLTGGGDLTADRTLGIDLTAETERVQDILGAALTDTATIDFTYNDGAGTVTADLKNTTVAAGSYGDATHVGQFTVDAQGRLTAAANILISLTGATTANPVTFNNSGAGAASGSTFNGSAAVTISFNSIGAVGTTGSPASGNLAKFSAANTITSGDLSGDVTTSGTLATTIANNAVTTAKINNAAVTLAKIANAAANSKLVGSGASGSGAAYSELTVGTGLTMTGTTLSVTGGSGGSGGVGWTELLYYDASTPTSGQVVDVSAYNDVRITVQNITKASSGLAGVLVSTDGGSTYFNTSGDYVEIAAAGTTANDAAFWLHATSTTAARYGTVIIQGLRGSRAQKFAETPSYITSSMFFIASGSPITHIKVLGLLPPSTVVNLNGGTILVEGR